MTSDKSHATRSKKRIGILGLGTYLPEKILTNVELEKIVETSDEWIRSRTGIRERRVIAKGQATSDLALRAAQQALAAAKLKPEDIELIIVATITPDMMCPATSCVVQRKLGARRAACFDVNAACAGFVFGLTTAYHYIANGMYQNALVIGAEVLSAFLDWKDRSTCVLFGDGAGAAVIGPVTTGGIVYTYLGSDGSGCDLLGIPGGGSLHPASHETVDQRMHYLKMNGSEVFKWAVRCMGDSIQHAIKGAGLKPSEIDCVIPHQANIRIIQSAVERIGVPLEKVYLNVERYGNMSAASTVVALAEAVDSGMIKRGSNVVLVAFGAGLAWGSCVIQW